MGNIMNIDQKQMQALMKQMGMTQEEISASKVTIDKTDGNKITIDNPSVIRLNVQGKESFQVSGDIKEETSAPSISEDDIKTIMEKTRKSEPEARKALEETSDLAEAILKLS